MVRDNVALRFQALITSALEVPPNVQQIDAWRQILGIEGASISVVLTRLAPVFQLPRELEEAISPLVPPGYEMHFMGWKPHVDRAFTTLRLDGSWSDFREPVSHHQVGNSLTACALELGRTAGREVPSQASLDELRDDVASLADDVAASVEIPPQVREFILGHLREINRAISECRFRGLASIEEVSERAVGALLGRPDVLQQHSRPIVKRFTDVLQALLLMVRISQGVKELTGDSLSHEMDRFLSPPAIQTDVLPSGDTRDT